MKKFFIFLVVLIVVGLVGIYQYLDVLAKNAIEKYGSEALGVNVRIDSVSIDLVKAQYTVYGLTVANPEGFSAPHIFDIGELETKIDYRTIFKDVFHIYHIRIENPKIFYEIASNGDNIKALRKATKVTSFTTADKATKEVEHKVIIEKFFFNKGHVMAGLQKVAEKSVTLPDIYIQNIGKDKNGISVQDASEQVLRELSKVIAQANINNLIKDLMSKGKVEDIKGAVKEHIDKLLGLSK